MSKVHNFSAGPAKLPEAVMHEVQAELLDWNGTGASVMEVSHRDKPFMAIAEACERDMREVLGLGSEWKLLFMQGGATAQFGIVPQNLLGPRRGADFVVTGEWGLKASKQFKHFGTPKIAATSEADAFTSIPDQSSWALDPDAAYLHITSNETIHGVEFSDLPETGGTPLVVDMSSNFASRPMNLDRAGLIYAGAQKNVGPAGLTIVAVRESLIGDAVLPGTLPVHVYKDVLANDSMLNTPSCFAWYVCGKVFRWILEQGGLEEIGRRNAHKAAILYDYLDGQDFYANPVRKDCRSLMNVPFRLANPALDAAFLAESKAAGMIGLKGHRIVGGMRASIYNAMTEEGVLALVSFMKDFVARHG